MRKRVVFFLNGHSLCCLGGFCKQPVDFSLSKRQSDNFSELDSLLFTFSSSSSFIFTRVEVRNCDIQSLSSLSFSIPLKKTERGYFLVYVPEGCLLTDTRESIFSFY